MKAIIATFIVLAPLFSNAYSETDRVSPAQKAAAIAQLAEARGQYFTLSEKTKSLLAALVNGQKELLRNGLRVTVLTHACATGTGESSCQIELGVQRIADGESTVIAIEYAIDKNGVVGGASESVIAD
ncbi:hypothetical protein ACLVWU_14275 [Bdellovibrio sp. HCB290]|uniref:hypothetical protein n=1 Tax=Bdellovibrio sp. HCB290 TaxID=3394356 RepID=UPI0039B60A7A